MRARAHRPSSKSQAHRRQTSSQTATDHHILIRNRARLLSAGLVLALCGLLARLVQLQALDARGLQRIAQRQQVAAITLQPRRGRIFDRLGRPLVVNLEVPSLYAIPHRIPDPKAFAHKLAPVLHLSSEEIMRRLRTGRNFAWLARKIPAEVARRVKNLDLGDQVGFLTESRRAYPNGPLGAHVVGFVGIDDQGLGGIEFSYDAILRGHPGKAVAERDGMGRVLVDRQRVVEAPADGSDLVLTIDEVLQHIAERELDKAMVQTRAHQGSVTVMDPKSGEILAMAVRPTFDPNTGNKATPEQWSNRPLTQSYEPGSTFKIILSAAALDSGVVHPEDRFFCTGSLVVGKRVIRDAHHERHGSETLSDIVRNSCNVGAAQVATRLGKERFYNYIRTFGFGQVVGIDLPGEATGIVPPTAEWRSPALQTIAFGQGISVTALQLLTAATSLVNDGWTIRPHVVRGIRDPQGRLIQSVGRVPIREVTHAETARATMQMLVRAVDEGTGAEARVPGYTVAGKTGTAQKPARGGGYDPDHYVASFLGVVPASDPKLLILVILDEPAGVYFGGTVAAPVFRQVASQALWYLHVPPDTTGFGDVTAQRRRSNNH